MNIFFQTQDAVYESRILNKQIAKALFVSEATVKSHLVHIFTKLDVDSRARAIHVATETGILPAHR